MSRPIPLELDVYRAIAHVLEPLTAYGWRVDRDMDGVCVSCGAAAFYFPARELIDADDALEHVAEAVGL